MTTFQDEVTIAMNAKIMEDTAGAVAFTGLPNRGAAIADWKKRNDPVWTKSAEDFGQLDAIMKRCASLASGALTPECEKAYQIVLSVLGASVPGGWLRKAKGTLVVPDGFMIDGGKVVAKVDTALFKDQVTTLMSGLDADKIKVEVYRNCAENNFFSLVVSMLSVPGAFELVAVCAITLLVGQEFRNILLGKLSLVKVMQNKQGKVAGGLVKMAGFMGLASAKENVYMTSACRFVKNPLLGEEPVDRELRQLKDETSAAFEERKTKHANGFAGYKKAMDDIKAFKGHFEALDKGLKEGMALATLKLAGFV